MLNRALGPRLAGLAVFAAALWAQHDGLIGVFFDDGIYVSLARSLATGEGYVNGHLPEPFPGVHYPPLYPWALSLLWRVWPQFPDNAAVFQLFDAACLGLAAWLIAAHARRLPLTPWVSATLVTAGLVAFPVLTIVGVRFSEPLFLALAAAAIALSDRAHRDARFAVAVGVLAGLATLTRSIGIAVVLGVALGYLTRRRWNDAALSTGTAALIVLPWTLWVWRHAAAVPEALAANYGTYASEVSQAGLGGLMHVETLGVLLPVMRLLLPSVSAGLWYTGAMLLVALIAWGAWSAWRSAPSLVSGATAYVAMVALWPYAPDRFIWIVLPWLLLFLALGLRAAWRAAPHAAPRSAVAALAALAILVGGAREWQSVTTGGFAATARGISAPMRALIRVINAELPADAVIASADEALIALYTGRRAMPAHMFHWAGRSTVNLDPAATHAVLCQAGVTHVAVTGPGDPAERIIAGIEPHFRLRGGPGLYRLACGT